MEGDDRQMNVCGRSTSVVADRVLCPCCAVLCVLLLQHLAGLQHMQREFLVQKLESPKQQQGKAEHLEQLVAQQQDAEEAAM